MRRKTTPPDRYTVSEAIRRGERASALMNDPVFREAVDRAAERFYELWLSSTVPADREAAWAKTHALGAIEDELRAIIADGEVAEHGVE